MATPLLVLIILAIVIIASIITSVVTYVILSGRNKRIRLAEPVSYTHLRAHETDSYLVCRLLLEKKKKKKKTPGPLVNHVLANIQRRCYRKQRTS